MEDIEQILEPEDLYEPNDEQILPPLSQQPFMPTNNDPRDAQRSRLSSRDRRSSSRGSVRGYSNEFYEDVHVNNNRNSSSSPAAQRKSPPKKQPQPPSPPPPEQLYRNPNRPSAFRSPINSSSSSASSTKSPNSPPQPTTHKPIASNPRAAPHPQTESISKSIKFGGSEFFVTTAPSSASSGSGSEQSEDVNRIMRKFDQIGISDVSK